ncbi:hypothetical protein N2152v2_000034 [Parachlorella kessleri]
MTALSLGRCGLGPSLQLAATATALLPRLELSPRRLSSPGRVAARRPAAAAVRAFYSEHIGPDVPPGRDPGDLPPDMQPEPKPRRNPDIYPGDVPDIPNPGRQPPPDVYPKYPGPDINPPDIGPPDLPGPNIPGQGPYMMMAQGSWRQQGGCSQAQRGASWHVVEQPDFGFGSFESAAEVLGELGPTSPLYAWPAQLPLLKTNGGNVLLEAEREFARLAGVR